MNRLLKSFFPVLLFFTVFAGGDLLVSHTLASDLDEFKVNREQVYEFTRQPQVSREGDQVTIQFAVKGYCDVTVVVEDRNGNILRHLASGVLGENAPEPFQKQSLEQKITWDSKDDHERYIDSIDECVVRVSLGLKPHFEKVLYWSPKKRIHKDAPNMCVTEEGVYVADGRVFDNIRLFDHDGNYLRTAYPAPANKLKEMKGLIYHKFPQSGQEIPLKQGFHQATYLTSGKNAGFDEKEMRGVDKHNNYHGSVWGNALSTMAVRNGRIAIARLRMNRLATDGSTGGLPLEGPETWLPTEARGNLRGRYRNGDKIKVHPHSSAFSPDNRYLYMTGYVKGHGTSATRDIVLISAYSWQPCVTRIDFQTGDKMEVFLGSADIGNAGSGKDQFETPTSVDVDKQGRIYVSDFLNNRIQVFDPSGKLLKSLDIDSPAQVCIDQKTQNIYVFSWWVPHMPKKGNTNLRKTSKKVLAFDSKMTVLDSFENPKPLFDCKLPLDPPPSRGAGMSYRFAVDSYGKETTIWQSAEWGQLNVLSAGRLPYPNVKLMKLVDKKLVNKHLFNEDVVKNALRIDVPEYLRQRLYVNATTGDLYIGEGDAAVGKSFTTLIRIDPDSGKKEIIELPFDAEDMCFDNQGQAYLRTFYVVVRVDAKTWKEIPWDYGEEDKDVRTTSSSLPKRSDKQWRSEAKSVLRLPVGNAGLHHHGGIGVSPLGNLFVAVNNPGKSGLKNTRRDIYDVNTPQGGKEYTPAVFPGRARFGEVHVFDRHGEMIYEDAIPGLTNLDGVQIDRDNNLYILTTATRVLDGKRYFNRLTGTLIKVKPKQGKMISASSKIDLKLNKDSYLNRPFDLHGGFAGNSWFDGAEWFYGGVGFSGKQDPLAGGGCNCYNARFSLDSLKRSFAPEVGHHSIAVLDTAGNLILRIGKYGNADSYGADSPVPLGGDEVGLFYGAYTAVHTDHRLFVADPGNARVISVKLNYHVNKKLPLSSLP